MGCNHGMENIERIVGNYRAPLHELDLRVFLFARDHAAIREVRRTRFTGNRLGYFFLPGPGDFPSDAICAFDPGSLPRTEVWCIPAEHPENPGELGETIYVRQEPQQAAQYLLDHQARTFASNHPCIGQVRKTPFGGGRLGYFFVPERKSRHEEVSDCLRSLEPAAPYDTLGQEVHFVPIRPAFQTGRYGGFGEQIHVRRPYHKKRMPLVRVA